MDEADPGGRRDLWQPPGGGGGAGGAYQQRPQPQAPPVGGPPPGPWGDPYAWNAASVAPRTQPEPPPSLRLAKQLMFVGAGLTVLSAVLFFAASDQLADSIVDENPYLTEWAVDETVERAERREVTRTVVGVCLWVWMAVKNSQGRKWARVVATIFGVIQLLGMLFAGMLFLSATNDDREILGYYGPTLVVGVVVSVLAVVILAQVYREASSRFYDDSTRWKAAMTLRRGY